MTSHLPRTVLAAISMLAVAGTLGMPAGRPPAAGAPIGRDRQAAIQLRSGTADRHDADHPVADQPAADHPTPRPAGGPQHRPGGPDARSAGEPGPQPSSDPGPGSTLVPDEPASYEYLDGAAPLDCTPLDQAVHAVMEDHRNWCAAYTGPTRVGNGELVGLRFQICRNPWVPVDGTLVREQANRRLGWLRTSVGPWRWIGMQGRSTQLVPATSSIVVGAGDCVRWTVPWRVADRHGRPLVAQQYAGRATFNLVRDEQFRYVSHLAFSVDVAG